MHALAEDRWRNEVCSEREGEKRETTVASTSLRPSENVGLYRILECAVILSWDELMASPTSGLIQIEYRTDAGHSLEYLKVWSSAVRGYANLVCEYWVRPVWSHAIGLQLAAGHNSAGFAKLLESAIQHQNTFANLAYRDGSIQIYPPTEAERSAAVAAQLMLVLANLPSAEPLLAA